MSPREDTLSRIGGLRLSAIIRARDEETARSAMEAAVEGGFRLVEFTLTTPGALGLIREFSAREGLVVGAGTVLSAGQADEAVRAGARFLVSPVIDPDMIAAARRLDAVSVPGTFTPTEMMAAMNAGADIAKLFPAPADVAAYVTQVRGPLPGLRILPTAGVTPRNFMKVLEAGAFGVGFVASLFTPSDLERRRFGAIEKRARAIHREFAGEG